MPININEVLKSQLNKRDDTGVLRYLKLTDDSWIDFNSNDYLGLSKVQEIFSAGNQFQDNGAGGSRLLSGNKHYHEAVEAYMADYFRAEATLLYNSGYMANLGVLSSVPQRGDTVILDELSHMCIKEGVRLSRANYYNFKHSNLMDLQAKLKKARGNKFIVVESVYSMDGDMAPLQEIAALAKQENAALIVDEAHSTGLHGDFGSGLCCHLGIEDQVFARIYTFGKAVGAHGAAIAGSELLKRYLINYSRQFIYTTALPYHSVISIQNALNYRKSHPELWEKLQANITLFKSLLQVGIPSLKSDHAIQGVILGSSEKAKAFSAYLNKQRFDIRPIVSPTVPKGSERVRICLHAFNSEKEITLLCQHINSYFQ